jgi:large subunit ribosomal protein L9
MQVILLQDVEKVGLRGEVVDVARGYARNYLLPRRLAETATPAKVAELEKRADLRARQEASTGSLFGSVTPTDLADEIWRVAKIRVDRRKIALGEPIKKVGRYEVPVELFTDVTVDVKTLVVPEGGELPPDEEAAPEESVPEETPAAEGASKPAPEPTQ